MGTKLLLGLGPLHTPRSVGRSLGWDWALVCKLLRSGLMHASAARWSALVAMPPHALFPELLPLAWEPAPSAPSARGVAARGVGLLLPCCCALPWSGHFWVHPVAVQSEHSGNGLREPHKLHWTLWASLPPRPLCPAAPSFWQAALWALTSEPRLFRVPARARTWSAGSALAPQPPAAVPYAE